MFEDLVDFYRGETSNKYRWDWAKQSGANSIEKMVDELGGQGAPWTTRNMINYRYLGFVRNFGNDDVRLTEAGEMFMSGNRLDKQDIVDDQIAKIWTGNPTNNKKHGDAYPLATLGLLAVNLDGISLFEFAWIASWIRGEHELPQATDLIQKWRALDANIRLRLIDRLSATFGDVVDSADRLWGILRVHSSFVIATGQDGSQFVKVIGGLKSKGYFEKVLKANRAVSEEDYGTWLDEPANIGLPNFFTPEQISDERPNLLELETKNFDADLYPELLISPPKSRSTAKRILSPRPKRDHVARQINLQEGGNKAEELVLEREIAFLVSNGREDLADRVRRVSLESDDYGFDIISFDPVGNERHLEIKGIKTKQNTNRVILTANEVTTAVNDIRFELIIVFNYESTSAEFARSELILNAVREIELTKELEDGLLIVKTQALEVVFSPLILT